MHFTTSRAAAFLGTVSFAALAATESPAAEIAAAAAPVEEVLITGSLIRGAEAVGVPVTALGTEEFQESGALTVSELLRSVPAVQVEASTSVAGAGGQINRAIGIDIHTLNSNTSPRTLMLINGIRFPAAGHGTDRFDPSIIPQLAVERVDVLADGASATYGSDAVAGVLNVIMKRGYNGAVTQLRYGQAQGGSRKVLASQLYGRTWENGDITLAYEWYDEGRMPGHERLDQFAFNYTPWGLDNRNLVTSSIPAVYSAGANPNSTLSSACTNCFSLPRGTGWNYGDTSAHENPIAPGSAATTTWAAILANPGALQNEQPPYLFADVLAAQQRNAATLTFDQQIFDGIEIFADAFYQNRRVQQRYPNLVNPARNQTNFRVIVPTTNPYYPTGAPAGIRANYSITAELQPKLSANEISSRWAIGANLDLPFEWAGSLHYAFNEEKNIAIVYGIANLNHVSAAVGNTVPATVASGTRPGQAAYVKPANIPFLNLFCDPLVYTCNSRTTLNYLSGYRDYHQHYQITEWGVNFDGPVYMLPGGELRAAVGAAKYSHTFSFLLTQNYNQNSLALIERQLEPAGQEVWAVFGQLNVPVFGEMNAIPLFQRLDLELSVRHDDYDNFGGTTNPKVGATWMPIEDLSLRGSYGTSFRAPSFSDASALSGVQIQPVNAATGSTNNAPACIAGETSPVPGSVAEAIAQSLSPGNPTCAGLAALAGSQVVSGVVYLGGITVRGGSGGAAAIRGGTVLGPEEATNYSFGFQYLPTNFLAGLDIEATYFHVKIDGLIQGIEVSAGGGLRDPNTRFTYIAPDDPNFSTYVAQLIRDPRTQVDTQYEPVIRFINDAAVRNVGYVKVDGIDFSVGYDLDLGNTGVFNAGIDGTYFLHHETLNLPGTSPVQAFEGNSQGCLFCAPPIPPRFRYRARLGWTSADDSWNANLFANYTSHYFHNQSPPPNPPPNYSNIVPAHVTLDLSLGYNTGDTPANLYLRELDFRLVVNNVLDKMPPFMYKTSFGGSNPAAFDISQSPIGRVWTIVLTKTW